MSLSSCQRENRARLNESFLMSSLSYRTVSAKAHEVEREWLLIDASDLVLGRISTRIATVLRGKHKPSFTPLVDTGDFVIVINAEKVKLTGNKRADKQYYSYSGYFGGLKSKNAETMLAEKPEYVIRHAVKGMLPKNRLGRAQLSKLKIYAGDEHPHTAQQPKPFPANV